MSFHPLLVTIIGLAVANVPMIAHSEADSEQERFAVAQQSNVAVTNSTSTEENRQHSFDRKTPNSANTTISVASSTAQPVSARELIEQKRYAEAIQQLEAAQNLIHNWEQNYCLGTAYLLSGRLEEASRYLDRALTLKGEIAEVWIQRAIVEQEKGNARQALRLLNVAYGINPDSTAIQLNAAYAYEQLQQEESARNAYSRFLLLSTNEPHNARLRQKIIYRLSRQ